MKLIACLLSILIPFSPAGASTHFRQPTRDGSALRWYVKRNPDHLAPELPDEFSRLSDYDGYYVDASCGEKDKVVYLTFDAGYENGNVEKILDTLKEKKVTGAFFVLSHFVTAEAELIERMIAEGHLVCNHTARHHDMARATDAEMKRELTDLETRYREQTGHEIAKYYRPPEGSFKWENLAVAKELGYATVFWSFAYADWDNDRQPSAEAAMRKIRDNLHPGAVLLLHPTSATNAKILPHLIDELRAQGYRFGTLDELTGRNGK